MTKTEQILRDLTHDIAEGCTHKALVPPNLLYASIRYNLEDAVKSGSIQIGNKTLTEPAQVGAQVFQSGNSHEDVIAQAKRYYGYLHDDDPMIVHYPHRHTMHSIRAMDELLRQRDERSFVDLKDYQVLLKEITTLREQASRTFGSRVVDWFKHCFSSEALEDQDERGARLAEETIETLQAACFPKDTLHELVEHVYAKPIGELRQEVGGLMTTLAVFCRSHGIDMAQAAEDELTRIWSAIDVIREKQKAKVHVIRRVPPEAVEQ